MPSSAPQPPNDFEDLESRLRRLSPAPPRAAFERRLGRELDSLSRNRQENRIVWLRFAPLAAAACLVLAGSWLLQRQLAHSVPAVPSGAPVITADSAPPAPPTEAERSFVSPPPISSGIPADRFVPVSSQQVLRETRQGGVVELSDQLPARELRLEYDDAWHWHDPETQTNIRVIRPREEVLLVPIEVD